MAQVAPYLAELEPDVRDRLTADATEAVRDSRPADPLALLVLRGSHRGA
jgi:hypothetical protein